MSETTSTSVSQRVHGSGIAHCGSYPTITAKFTITFTRATPNDPTVSWSLTMAPRSQILPTSTTASFGYKFFTYVRIDDGQYYTIISKNNTQGTNWTSSSYTAIYNQSGTFTSTESTAWVALYCRSRECASNGHYCYQGSGNYTYIKGVSAELPPYVSESTITYNANGGTGAPEAQIKEVSVPITLSTTVPVYELPINYHNPVNPTIINLYRPFTEWNTAQDGTGVAYDPGDSYTTDSSCTLYAQWNDATLDPLPLDHQYITVTYDVGQGSTAPTPTQHLRVESGYSIAQGSTTVAYQVGTTYNITTPLDLYPVYGDATVAYATLPIPTKLGYAFDGWYRDAQLTTKVTSDILTSTDIILYAKWKFIPVRKFDGNTWQEDAQYVWRFNGTDWEKVAHIYLFNGSAWIDQSVE